MRSVPGLKSEYDLDQFLSLNILFRTFAFKMSQCVYSSTALTTLSAMRPKQIESLRSASEKDTVMYLHVYSADGPTVSWLALATMTRKQQTSAFTSSTEHLYETFSDDWYTTYIIYLPSRHIRYSGEW